MVDRVREEIRVHSQLAALSASGIEYRDVVASVLDSIEDLVESPLLTLSLREHDGIRHYHRVAPDIDEVWRGEAALFAAEMARQHLLNSQPKTPVRHEHHLAAPPAWVVQFTACTRSGRPCAISLAAGQPVEMGRDEEGVMTRLMRQVALVLDHVLLVERLEDLEVTDRLTGVVNQRRLLEILEYEMQRHRHSGGRLALIMIDVEGLDRINRNYGRQYGNHILQRVAGMLREAVRPIDIVARSGLDEFAVVLPDTDGDDAEGLAERICEEIHAAEFAGGTIGLSAGVAHVRPEETIAPEALLRRAENDLEARKRQDRSRSALIGQQRRRAW